MLDLEYAHIVDADMEGAALCNEVQTLNLIDNHITDDGVRRIRFFRRLEKLYIGGSHAREITDKGLLSLSRLRQLREFELRKTGVQGPGLAVLENMPNLESLSLWDSNVDNSGLPHLKKLRQLKRLVVGRTMLTPDAIQELRDALPDCEVIDDA